MVFVSGDIHGSHGIRKLSTRRWPEGRGLTRDDCLVILGDFGLVWSDPPSGSDRWWLDWLEAKPWTTLFVDGNHENHDLLAAMPVVEWNGGRVHEVRPHVLHLMRGEVFDLPCGGGTASALAFGGARSHDIGWRQEGKSWWPTELPDEADYCNAVANLDKHGWRVDYVFTHDCPGAAKAQVLGPMRLSSAERWGRERWEGDRLTGYLDDISGRLAFRRWYFGHYHVDMPLSGGRYTAVYGDIIRLGTDG